MSYRLRNHNCEKNVEKCELGKIPKFTNIPYNELHTLFGNSIWDLLLTHKDTHNRKDLIDYEKVFFLAKYQALMQKYNIRKPCHIIKEERTVLSVCKRSLFEEAT